MVYYSLDLGSTNFRVAKYAEEDRDGSILYTSDIVLFYQSHHQLPYETPFISIVRSTTTYHRSLRCTSFNISTSYVSFVIDILFRRLGRKPIQLFMSRTLSVNRN